MVFFRIVLLPFKACSSQDSNGSHIERQQFAIRLAYACTIHKSQGMTLDKAVVNIGKEENPIGSTYVGLSRVKRLQDLLLHPFDFQRLLKIVLPSFVLNFVKKSEEKIKNTFIKYKHLISRSSPLKKFVSE